MRNQRMWVLAAGVVMVVAAMAGVSRDATAWEARRFRIPADIIERLMPPTHKVPADGAGVRRMTTAKSGLRALVSATRRTER